MLPSILRICCRRLGSIKKTRSIDTKCVNKLLMIDVRHENAAILAL